MIRMVFVNKLECNFIAYKLPMHYIYILSDPITNEIRYIGKTNNVKRRKAEHLSEYNKTKNVEKRTHKNKWIESLRKNGIKPVFEVWDTVDESDASFWECHYISLFKSWGIRLTNLTDGGDGVKPKYGKDNVFVNNKEVRDKILAMNRSRKGKTFIELYGVERAEEMRRLKSERFKGANNPRAGIKMTHETKDKISKGNKGKTVGIKKSEEFKKNLSIKLKGRIFSQATKNKMKVAALNRPPKSLETRKKISINNAGKSLKGTVYQLHKETKVIIREWKGTAQIKDEYGNKSCNISSCITGKLKSAYGYIWTRNI